MAPNSIRAINGFDLATIKVGKAWQRAGTAEEIHDSWEPSSSLSPPWGLRQLSAPQMTSKSLNRWANKGRAKKRTDLATICLICRLIAPLLLSLIVPSEVFLIAFLFIQLSNNKSINNKYAKSFKQKMIKAFFPCKQVEESDYEHEKCFLPMWNRGGIKAAGTGRLTQPLPCVSPCWEVN